MAADGLKSNIIYLGKVYMVKKKFGLLKLRKGVPAPAPIAYFDRSSVNFEVNDLTEHFKKGCKVKCCLKQAGGDRSPPKAIHLILDNENYKEIRCGDIFLKKYLEDGAVEIEKLAHDLNFESANCPRFLREGHIHRIQKVVDFRPEWFEIKSRYVCLTLAEIELVTQILENMSAYGNKISLTELNGIIRPDHQYRRYLRSTGEGLKDFVLRNASLFIFWDGAIWNVEELTKDGSEIYEIFQDDMLAVMFYSQFLSEHTSLSVASLMSYAERADDEVKEAAGGSEEVFKEFLVRNSFFFVLQDEGDIVKECMEHRLRAAQEHWCKRKTKSQSVVIWDLLDHEALARFSAVSAAGYDSSSQLQDPVQVFSAFSDLGEEMVLSKGDELFFMTYQRSIDKGTLADPLLADSLLHSNGSCETTHRIQSQLEMEAFRTIIGDEIVLAIGWVNPFGKSLQSLTLLRLNVGARPKAKFQILGEDCVSVNLKVDPVTSADLRRIMTFDNIFQARMPGLFGVKDTLHSIRTVMQGDSLTGLILFCQLHGADDGLSLDIWQGKNLTAVYPGDYPNVCISNYLRCKSKILSEKDDVLVIDMDGKLSGCDDLPHPSLGNVTRVLCFSPCELSKAITESARHMHDCVIVKEVYAVEDLRAVQRLCRTGSKVLAEVCSDLKSEVESTFC